MMTVDGNGALATDTLKWAVAQKVLFADKLRRLEVLNVDLPRPARGFTVVVHRNHALEHVTDLANPWFAFWGMGVTFEFGGYSDALPFTQTEAADLHLVTVNCERYRERMAPEDLADWLRGRVAALRRATDAPILVVPVADDEETYAAIAQALGRVVGARVAPVNEIRTVLGEGFFDPRLTAQMGTPLSGRACLQMARHLACHWIPPLLQPSVKAIALDLDNTLYAGVLGEDGADVVLTEAHRALQKDLVALADQGVMLAVVSRNEPNDARALFEERDDFPLRWSHFCAAGVSWSPKSQALASIVKDLNIGADALVFVDDNPGELAEVSRVLGVRTIFAGDPDETRRTLHWFPGLWVWSRSETDLVRTQDARANRAREALAASTMSDADYFRSLEVTLSVEVDPAHHHERLYEMSRKTNQFNLNVQRLTDADMACRLSDPQYRVASVALRDRLSESGIVAMLVARLGPNEVIVEELLISCRALGRKLETIMVAAALDAMTGDLASRRLTFQHTVGPRNEPARRWLADLAAVPLPRDGITAVPVDRLLSALATGLPIHIEAVLHHGND